MDIEQARFNMIEQQIRPWDVLDNEVLRTIEETPRELFVPTQYKKLAFSDLEIPLPHHQVMMMPKVEARMMQALQIQPGDEILEIGTGSGFVTACLAKLGKHVDSIEYYEDLSLQAQNALQQLNIQNISLSISDISTNPLPNKRYDIIAITASIPFYTNRFEQYLAENGRLFVIVGQAPVMEAQLITNRNNNDFVSTSLFETNLPALIGTKAPQKFKL